MLSNAETVTNWVKIIVGTTLVESKQALGTMDTAAKQVTQNARA